MACQSLLGQEKATTSPFFNPKHSTSAKMDDTRVKAECSCRPVHFRLAKVSILK